MPSQSNVSEAKVTATIYTQKVKQQLSLDLAKHLPRKGNRTPLNKLNAVRNAQYQAIDVKQYDRVHDRFLKPDEQYQARLRIAVA